MLAFLLRGGHNQFTLNNPLTPATPVLPDREDRAAGIVRQLTRRLVSIARGRLAPRNRARFCPEDVVQSVYRTFFRRYPAGCLRDLGSDSLARLLGRITARKCATYHARHAAEARDVGVEVRLEGDPPGPGPDPASDAAARDAVEHVVAGFDPSYRPLLDRLLAGTPAAEVAAQLGVPERTAYRVRERLERRLTAAFFPSPPTADAPT
ncbi:MAG: ECF-type sigma factor [Gemmataceae bacterium]